MTTAEAAAAQEIAERRPPEHHHRDLSGGWLRAAVFGAMDGLVSNVALISGVAGGGVSDHVVMLTGLAGLVGGAFSMAVGEYTSVQSQNEATAAELAMEARELSRSPRAEAAELAQAWVDRGVPADLAQQMAAALSQNPEQALRVHAQEELGVDPDRLPSPLQAALSSFSAFCVGAVIPLVPYFVGGRFALLVAFVLAALGLFGAGSLVSRFTGRSAVFSGGRQLGLGAVAAAVTYGIGAAVGTGVAG
jgi:VIT1/CCC1 family predicted Fe2+/Mn2+ transporter